MEDPHLDAVGFFRRREHDVEGAYFEQSPPVRFAVSGYGKHASAPSALDNDGEAVRSVGWKAFKRNNDG
jgi:hypothetical protein